jgi:hypothetical protein
MAAIQPAGVVVARLDRQHDAAGWVLSAYPRQHLAEGLTPIPRPREPGATHKEISSTSCLAPGAVALTIPTGSPSEVWLCQR